VSGERLVFNRRVSDRDSRVWRVGGNTGCSAQGVVGGSGRRSVSVALNGNRGDRRRSLVGVSLNLALEVCGSVLSAGSDLGGVLASNLLRRLELSVDKVGRELNLVVDKLLVVEVNQGRGECSNGSLYELAKT
jgi:hypothetical protein